MSTKVRTRNGIDLAEIGGWVAALKEHPDAGRITVHTRHRWDGAAAVDGFAEGIDTVEGTIPRTQTFRSDYPEAFGGGDTGPIPGELLLAALGGCVTATYAEKATLMGVDLTAIEATIEASVDLRGAYGIGGVKVGLSEVSVTLRVESDADDATLEELGRAALGGSPVADSLAHPVPVRLSAGRRA